MEVNYLKIIQCDLDSVSQLRCTYDENYRSPFFVSGKTWKIGSVSNTYLPHCTYTIAKSIAAKYSWPNTNDLYIHYMDKSTGTPPLEEKKALPNCGNKDGNIIQVLKISTSVATVLKCMKWLYHMYKSLVFGDEFLAQGLHLKSHQMFNFSWD